MNIFKKALIVALSVGLISVPTVTKEVEAASSTIRNTTRVYVDFPTWDGVSNQGMHYWFNDELNGTDWNAAVAGNGTKVTTDSSFASVNSSYGNYYFDCVGSNDVALTGIIPLFKQGEQWRPGSSGSEKNITSCNGEAFKVGAVYSVNGINWNSNSGSTKYYSYSISHVANFYELNANGGLIAGASSKVLEISTGSLASLSSYVPTLEGKTFAGWYVSSDETKTIVSSFPSSAASLSAKWVDSTYTVNYYTEKDSVEVFSTVNVEANGTLTTPVEPTKEGYSFAGWYNKLDDTEYNSSSIVTENLDLYAKWTYTGIAYNTKVRIFFYNSEGWEIVNHWNWDDNGTNYSGGEWPGQTMNRLGETDYYYLDAKVGTKVIFNNGSSQTSDLSINADGKYLYDYSTRSWSSAENINVFFQKKTNETDSTKSDIRLIATLGNGDQTTNLEDYSNAGFSVLDSKGTSATIKYTSKVYTSVEVNGATVTAEELNADYIFVITVSGVPSNQYLQVTPFVQQMDGKMLLGTAKTFVVL